jgi:predicted transcriptional regulator
MAMEKTFNFGLDEQLYNKMQELASKQERTMAGEMRLAIREHLAANGIEIIEEAVDDQA